MFFHNVSQCEIQLKCWGGTICYSCKAILYLLNIAKNLYKQCWCLQGVVHTYGSLQAQIVGMEDRWAWASSDVLLHVLPLHHVHGNVNCLMTPMWCGACCVMMPSFDAAQVRYIVYFFSDFIVLMLNICTVCLLGFSSDFTILIKFLGSCVLCV